MNMLSEFQSHFFENLKGDVAGGTGRKPLEKEEDYLRSYCYMLVNKYYPFRPSIYQSIRYRVSVLIT